MNYTQLLIDDKKIGLKFGMASFRYLQGKFINGIAFSGDEINEIGISHILYSGYYNNCLIKDEVPSILFEEFVDIVEKNITNDKFLENIKEIMKIWSECDVIKQSSQENKPEAKKKIIRGKK